MDEGPRCPVAAGLTAAAGTPMGNNFEIEPAKAQARQDGGGA
jgi:hypothetical protein